MKQERTLKGSTRLAVFAAMSASIVALGLLGGCEKKGTESKSPTESAKKTGQQDEPARPAAGSDDGPLASVAGTYEVDPVHSAVAFRVKHLNVSHTLGRFNKIKGTIVLDPDPANSTVDIEVDAASVFTADKKRDDHIKSPDFLNVAQYPTIRFKTTSIKSTGDDRFEVTGDLELHGVKNSVTAQFELVGSGNHPMDESVFLVGFTGELEIARSDYGMKSMVGPVGDEIHLTIAVEAGKK